MGELDKALVEELKRRLPSDVMCHIRRMVLYGSRARGEATEDSDLDLVALVDEKTPVIEQKLDDITYKLMWDNDFKPIISLKVFQEDRFRAAYAKGFSYYRNVEMEGVTV
jgi:predicted nucleotidyltransferase